MEGSQDAKTEISVDVGAHWVALEKADSALLLVGAASNATGVTPRQDGQISPSADPIGNIKAMFVGSGEQEKMSLSHSLSYVWKTVRETDSDSLIRPEIERFGVFGGMAPASEWLAEEEGLGKIRFIVVGSSVYIKQV
jgi:hypothetical protein